MIMRIVTVIMVTSLVMADVTFPETPVVKRGKTVRVAEDTGDISITLRSGVGVLFFTFGSDRSSRKADVHSFVCSFGSSLSRAVNLHHSGSNLQTISQEYVSSK